jgi:predicted acyltransferase
MVFVNDLWTDKGIPLWLEHAPGNADALGFADIIFPAFLFIVGLSIPYSQQNRIDRGLPPLVIFRHIVFRSFALIVMGFFQMNMETYSKQSPFPEPIWIILVTVSFFMIWLDYPKSKPKLKVPLQLSGIILLIVMALLYKGHSPQGTTWMSPHWWGILGLIGWAYFACATISLFFSERLIVLIAFFILFVSFNSAVMLNPAEFSGSIIRSIGLGNASDSSVTILGLICGVIYKKFSNKAGKPEVIFIIMAAALFIFGFSTRPLWGISKIRATPSWTTICAAISIIAFTVLIFLIDKKRKQGWFNVLKPAGTSTLTCYLLPYLHEAIFLSIIGVHLPLFIRTGWLGVIKSLLFSLIIVMITGLLEKKHLRLKI